ncbi:nuclear receptor subfamily 1 group D member 2b isoform X2 [Cynoglossus semilaevis]|uniref:nuclear receptor subfamily 1 group D member 2b isoform X2 n=1 Tax=Cynoglossus semilaevis TaxID=244447 RepID=UPI00049672BD|nr:nuclear receptor subfamily 1 group D member 2-like isoform X2 [Cynoglossus semilaevis]
MASTLAKAARRSIQQNIHYKKCLKNGTCPIMRINRNRCQQCRLRKCLMVGMSRDSVRFGRIPKREKQRMLLEMQNAMNNIINNGQLNSQLQSSQMLPAALSLPINSTESTSEQVGYAASSSPCSSVSDTNSDPEPAMKMDTSPSSASPCASDSGEEEGIGSGTKAHITTPMNKQEQITLSADSTVTTGSLDNGVDQNVADDQRDDIQDAWNCQNNMASKSTPVSLGPKSYEDKIANHSTSRLFPSTVGQSQGTLRILSSVHEVQSGHWLRDGRRMYLGCPMNTAPNIDSQKSGHEVWDEFMHSFTPAVREVVEFAKKIPGFRDLSQHDQVNLLKAGTFEVLVVRFASLFDAKERTVTFLGGKKYSVDTLRSMGASEFLNSMFDFSEKLTNLGLSEEEMSLFTAVVLVSADRSGIENVNSVEALQDTLICALRNLITKNHPNELATFTKLLLKLPDLRSLNNMHSEQLLAFKIHS